MSNLPVLKNIIGSPNIAPPPKIAAPPSRADAAKNIPVNRAARGTVFTSGRGVFGNLDLLKKKLGSGVLFG